MASRRRMDAAKAAAPFVHPKLAPVQADEPERPLRHVIYVEYVDPPVERPKRESAEGALRSDAGIDRALSNGERRENGAPKYAGRPADAALHARVRDLLASGMRPSAVAREADCSRSTVYRIRDEMKT